MEKETQEQDKEAWERAGEGQTSFYLRNEF